MEDWRKQIEASISDLFNERECNQISRILWEDLLAPIAAVEAEDKVKNVMEKAIQSICSGIPVAYVTGIMYFYGRPFHVSPDVLIPRPETEELVYTVLQQTKKKDIHVLDVGCGSGCIPVTLKLERPEWQVETIDISPAALEIAKKNNENLGSDIHFHTLDFLEERNWDKWTGLDVIVSNPPYIDRNESDRMTKETLAHEPDIALFAPGKDPLIFYRKLADFGKKKIKKGGLLCLELNEFKAREIERIFLQTGIFKTEIVMDMQGKERILIASLKD